MCTLLKPISFDRTLIVTGTHVPLLRKCLYQVDLQRQRAGHPPAESGFKTKAINGTIGTLSVYITVDYAEYQAE